MFPLVYNFDLKTVIEEFETSLLTILEIGVIQMAPYHRKIPTFVRFRTDRDMFTASSSLSFLH